MVIPQFAGGAEGGDDDDHDATGNTDDADDTKVSRGQSNKTQSG